MPVRGARWRAVVPVAAALSVLAAVISGTVDTGPARTAAATAPDYATLGRQAVATLEDSYYHGSGMWNMCIPATCGASNHDWGADSLTYALSFHWQLTGDQAVVPLMDALTATARTYTASTAGWSDAPLWDSVADAREYQATGNPVALAKAEAAFSYVATGQAASFAAGACPAIQYQQAGGGGTKLKTLETGANYIKAALLLYQITQDAGYLRQAQAEYAAARQYFLDPAVPLYTVYVFDDGSACRQLPGRFFGSVNGLMISNGLTLAQDTGQAAYRTQAIATAEAVSQHLNDAAGVYADLQAENDVTEPLIEAMYDLAAQDHQAFAQRWLLTAASAAASGATAGGEYGRFFDGPPPRAPVPAWQVAGGLALEQAAGALDPAGRPTQLGSWSQAVLVPDDLSLALIPVRFTFTGRAVAIMGTLGEICCQSGHARVFIDGKQTFDQTGIWQNKSSSRRTLPNSILFAWRWPTPGTHTIEIVPGIPDAKEGGSFFHMTGYLLVK
jgi:hypothetical protein